MPEVRANGATSEIIVQGKAIPVTATTGPSVKSIGDSITQVSILSMLAGGLVGAAEFVANHADTIQPALHYIPPIVSIPVSIVIAAIVAGYREYLKHKSGETVIVSGDVKKAIERENY